jgi:hypothetical protein
LNLRPLGYETTGPHLRRAATSKQSRIRAALRAALSHRVPGHAACPRRLYYTRYYTRAVLDEPADDWSADPAPHGLPRVGYNRTVPGGAHLARVSRI